MRTFDIQSFGQSNYFFFFCKKSFKKYCSGRWKSSSKLPQLNFRIQFSLQPGDAIFEGKKIFSQKVRIFPGNLLISNGQLYLPPPPPPLVYGTPTSVQPPPPVPPLPPSVEGHVTSISRLSKFSHQETCSHLHNYLPKLCVCKVCTFSGFYFFLISRIG
jgi:hypothetical protein